ncbi:NUDIX domain-containing protein [Candidatus Woesearchaeota archaeon]|nr:NUDIX domain-containing protein [Candidatus Woesearchaeota archaeon]
MTLPALAVKAIIMKDGKILLLQRNPATRGVANWDLPGGLVEEGEGEVESLLRELREELGVGAEVLERSGSWRFFRPKDERRVDVHNYRCRLLDGDIRLSEEHVSYHWVLVERLRSFPVKDASLYGSLEKHFQNPSRSSSL